MVSDHIVRHHSDAPFGSEPSNLISFSKNRKNVSKKLFTLLVTFPKNLKNLKNLKDVSKKIVCTSRDFSQKSQKSRKSQKSQKCVKKNVYTSRDFSQKSQNLKNVSEKNCLHFS